MHSRLEFRRDCGITPCKIDALHEVGTDQLPQQTEDKVNVSRHEVLVTNVNYFAAERLCT